MVESGAVVCGKPYEHLRGKCIICGQILRANVHGDGDRHDHRGHPASCVGWDGHPKTPKESALFEDPSRFRCPCGVPVIIGDDGQLVHDEPACAAFGTASYVAEVLGPVTGVRCAEVAA